MTKITGANIITEDDKEIFIIVSLNNGKELHITVYKSGKDPHAYLWEEKV